MVPVRVLQCFTILNRGGAETMVMNYYRKLDRTKIQFDFLVHRDEIGAYEEEILKLGGKIYRLQPVHPLNYFKYKEEVQKFFIEHPEYKIIHGHLSELGCWLYEEANKQGVPHIIVHAHNYSREVDLKSIFRFYWKHKMRKDVTHYFSCSDKSSEWLFGRDNVSKTTILNNAIDAQNFEFDIDIRTEYREKLGFKNKFVVGHVGRFNKQKNHTFLLKIFCEIKKQHHDSILVLVGTGVLEEKIKKEIRRLNLVNDVVFLGNREDVNCILQAMDVFLFPSKFEGLGVALIEAQASGIKCFTSKAYVPKESQVTNLLEYIELEKGSKYWARQILGSGLNYQRESTIRQITEAGYNVDENVKWLEGFYLNECN